MSPDKLQALEEAYEKIMAISLNQIPLEQVEELVADDIMGYGTTLDEEVHDLEGYIELIKFQEHQAKELGLDVRLDRKTIHRRISPEEDTALFIEQIQFIIHSDEVENKLTIRFSALLEYTNAQWKLVHWHGSIPSDTQNDTWHVNEWLAEKKKLEQLVKERTEELKAVQEQLIHQEKLASLGQLTAGIAHEIKNPLNFVNNFSDLSIELIDEAREELAAFGDEAEEIFAILDDIEANLKKIYDHGSRADNIVKSMLLHSKGGSGTKQATDLNSLVEEYLTLSFHGMRAGTDPINVDLQMDLDPSIDSVNINPEDMSRVFINLFNNAFDAMREKLLNSERVIGQSEKYHPKLVVRTKKSGNGVTILIEDNGPGIPDDIKHKILQPFYTTKKGTQGTGLGLSITNDIIKAHGGSLSFAESGENGTTFKIELEA